MHYRAYLADLKLAASIQMANFEAFTAKPCSTCKRESRERATGKKSPPFSAMQGLNRGKELKETNEEGRFRL